MSKKSRKRKSEDGSQSPVDWEEENIFSEEIKNEMESMWEIPQIFQFLHLAKEALNIPHLSMYEMERMLLIPRASKQLANIMTCLLSSPMTKSKLRKVPPMPYEFWTNILAYKMKSWFKVYEAKHQDPVKILETIGVEPEFWNVFPDAPLLNGKDFEELTFKQKVWLLKTVCDTVMHSRKSVQEEIAKQPWENQFETVLGTDRYGARYVYFPQFLKSDLRVYRHCLDNKIFSTVKVPLSQPIKPKLHAENEELDENELIKKQVRRRRRRWCNGLPPKLKRKGNKCDEKQLNDIKSNSDSATSSLINEDTSLSNLSTCSDSNSNNNNDINPTTINVKRPRSSSKCSEVSMESDKTCCTKSSGYDTNRSIDNLSESKSPERMFKGFSNSSDITNKKCDINVINGLLTNLQSEFSEIESTEDSGVSLTHTSPNKLEITSAKEQYLDALNLHATKSEPVDRTIDSLCSVSKTDDEKLNEIISAESLKVGSEAHQMTTSKSDDEKLSETRINCDATDQSEGKEGNEIIERPNGQYADSQQSDNLNISDKETPHSKATSKSNNEIESNDDKDLSLSELRCMLQKEAMDDEHYLDEERKKNYNDRKLKNNIADMWHQEVENFNEMLSELSSSEFQLVADSVSSLRDLIASFSQKDDDTTTDADGEDESIPPCEVSLIKEMMDLLATVEKIESALRESTRRARGKLQKEWTNFKEGSVEDQDSSGEGLDSNWWVLGSQSCPPPTSGDSTLQTLPHFTISPTGSQNVSNQTEDRQADQRTNSVEFDKNSNQQCKEHQGESTQDETQRSQSNGGEGSIQDGAEDKKESKEDSNQEELQSGRVLRARGVSSYTFYSDDETEENELEEWPDLEAIYAAPTTQADSSTPYLTTKIRNLDSRTNEEDSDQDWILPSSRKRKNKRPSASRRLKSFQHKLQSIKVDTLQNMAEPIVTTPINIKNQKPKPKIKEIQICKPEDPLSSENPDPAIQNAVQNHDTEVQSTADNHDTMVQNTTENGEAVVQDAAKDPDTVVQNNPKEPVPSTEITCKIENVESVHSELDIKDEGPIYDCMSQCDNTYATNFNQNYVMVRDDHNPINYYVMQPNPVNVATQNTYGQPSPVVSNIISPVQQGYYMQGGQNYIIQNPQPNFIPSQPFQPQGPQMIAPQQFISQPGYLPYMMTPTQSHPEYVPAGSQTVAAQEMPQNPMYIQPPAAPPPRPVQNRYIVPRQNLHSHGAVIRSSMPIRGSFPRANTARGAKTFQQPRGSTVRPQKPRKQIAPAETTGQKTTSLIVLSDSDDEIEMIITETSPGAETEKTKTTHRKNYAQSRQNVTQSNSPATKSAISPQIIQRMTQGGISITPIKSAPPVQNSNTQLVVVVNETGSHYALALPNGSKLILTPEQVAQIRASNGGKLIL
ncbi:uncharacterized protein LOC100878137 isoform X1 [Megachile rotundata]|uniref:uncharacterized protein LOC100878137 isoform X1 n=1 Tax=Megachile rotundata TaxID=143995 RepID=UPI003FD49156